MQCLGNLDYFFCMSLYNTLVYGAYILCSYNFTPVSVFLEYFKQFLAENGDKLKSEFYIPLAVNNLIVEGRATCEVLDTPSKWFGVTYAEDRPQVVLKINELIRKGVYPKQLFK